MSGDRVVRMKRVRVRRHTNGRAALVRGRETGRVC